MLLLCISYAEAITARAEAQMLSTINLEKCVTIIIVACCWSVSCSLDVSTLNFYETKAESEQRSLAQPWNTSSSFHVFQEIARHQPIVKRIQILFFPEVYSI